MEESLPITYATIYVTRPAKRALMGDDVIMQKTMSEKHNNFEQVRVAMLYLDRDNSNIVSL
jgi:hypothetical protein